MNTIAIPGDPGDHLDREGDPHDDSGSDGTARQHEQRTAGAGRAHRGRGQRRRKFNDADDVLDALERVASLVALGVIAPATANSLRGILGEFLRHFRGRAERGGIPGVTESLLQQARDNPELANLLEPFLTDAQIEELLGGREPDDDEQV